MVNVLDLAARGIGEGGDRIVSASRSSGSKLPRHRFFSCHRFFLSMGLAMGTASRPSGDKSPRHKGGINPFTTQGSGDKSSHHNRGWGIG